MRVGADTGVCPYRDAVLWGQPPVVAPMCVVLRMLKIYRKNTYSVHGVRGVRVFRPHLP